MRTRKKYKPFGEPPDLSSQAWLTDQSIAEVSSEETATTSEANGELRWHGTEMAGSVGEKS
jgi:hypothetical protein